MGIRTTVHTARIRFISLIYPFRIQCVTCRTLNTPSATPRISRSIEIINIIVVAVISSRRNEMKTLPVRCRYDFRAELYANHQRPYHQDYAMYNMHLCTQRRERARKHTQTHALSFTHIYTAVLHICHPPDSVSISGHMKYIKIKCPCILIQLRAD